LNAPLPQGQHPHQAKHMIVLRWMHRRRAEMHLGIRITVAGLVAFVLAELAQLPQSYWAVFTAVLVTQASVGGSLTAARDRLIGTIGGAAYSAVVAVLIPHSDPWMLGVALAVSLAPLAVLGSINPIFRVAPVTAVIMLLGTVGAQEGPILAALLRTAEVTFGGVVGLAVSVLVLPKRGSMLVFEGGNRLLNHFSNLLHDLLSGLVVQLEPRTISNQHEAIQSAFDKMEAAALEADRERRTYLSIHVDLAPLPRTLRRVYHDLVLIGRVASRPLPQTDAPIAFHAAAEGRKLFTGLGVALTHRQQPPSTTEFEAAIHALSLKVCIPRTLEAGPEDASRRATLGFALEQLERDVRDLAERAREFVRDKTVKS
jgi:uncharacterized membrane protein YccC